MEDWQIQGIKITAYKKAGLQKVANDLNKKSLVLLRTIEKGGDMELILHFFKDVIESVNEVPGFMEEAVKLLNEEAIK
jgi:hypothetical protein